MAKKLSDEDAPTNTPGADDTVKLFLEAERLKGKVDEANGKLRAHLKLMEERGVNLKAVALLRKLRRLDSDEATLLMRDVARMGRWLQVPLFSQAELFAADDAGAPSEATQQAVSEHEAEREGFEAGKAGRAANDTRFEAGTAEHAAFGRGWVRGQASIAARMTDDPAKAQEARAAGGRRPGRRKKADDLTSADA
jgi:hypothetical protein